MDRDIAFYVGLTAVVVIPLILALRLLTAPSYISEEWRLVLKPYLYLNTGKFRLALRLTGIFLLGISGFSSLAGVYLSLE